MDCPLKIENLSFQYHSRERKSSKTPPPRPALDRVSLAVEKSEIFGLLGPNGGGKTTLFKILSTLYAAQSGSAQIFGMDLQKNSDEVRQKIGVVFQSPSLDKKLTGFENLRHQGHLYGMSGSGLESKIREALNRIGMSEKAQDLAETLSGGQQRRLEIAKGLLHSPELLLMDEPTTGLDPGARRDFWDYVLELKKSGITVLLTTHLMEEAEKCGRIAILSEGRVVALGTPLSLKEEIGGDVITIEVKDAPAVARAVKSKFGLDGVVLDDKIHIEKGRGHEFVPQLISAFSDEILSVTLSKPTLEDVFIRRTGHKFWKGRDE